MDKERTGDATSVPTQKNTTSAGTCSAAQKVQAPSAAVEWKMAQPKVRDKLSRFVTPCCDYEFLANDCPVKWNEFNKVVQCHNCGHVYGPRIYPSAAERSEQLSSAKATDDKQEWTHEKLQGLLGINNEDRYVADHAFENTLDEINAALGGECQRREQAEHWLGELLAVIHCDGGHYQSEHGTETATNDAMEKRNQLVARIDVLEYQLLSAQAAIEKVKQIKPRGDLGAVYQVLDILKIVESMDLSLLHQHDAEVRKPLVDALHRLAMRVLQANFYLEAKEETDTALAQCKP